MSALDWFVLGECFLVVLPLLFLALSLKYLSRALIQHQQEYWQLTDTGDQL